MNRTTIYTQIRHLVLLEGILKTNMGSEGISLKLMKLSGLEDLHFECESCRLRRRVKIALSEKV